MAFIILEGIDRTGKSTVAAYFESLGFEVVHQSAPHKGMSRDEYLQEQVDLVSSASTRDIILDRSYYGEAVIWPNIYGRKPLIDEDDIDLLREIEDTVGVRRILMHDTDFNAHWMRCVNNKEPLDKSQFVRARALYSEMTEKYGFERVTLQQFLKQYPEAVQFNNVQKPIIDSMVEETNTESMVDLASKHQPQKTKEQLKLEKANVINDILSKRILKIKGIIYDELENDLRLFLNDRLGKLLGNSTSPEVSLSKEEVKFFKDIYAKAVEKTKQY